MLEIAMPSLTVLTMIAKRPERVAGQLGGLRSLADAIIVTAHDSDSLEQLADVADRRLLIDPAPKARHLGWLLNECRTEWILVLDDDEVIMPELIGEMPDLLDDRHIHLVLLPRRWLYPSSRQYVDTSPWVPDLQPQLLRNLPGSWRFPGRAHEAFAMTGPNTIAPHGLYHTALLDLPVTARERKYEAYERVNPGRGADGIPVNLMGLPEHCPGLRLAPVPDHHVAAIERFDRGAQPDGPVRSPIERADLASRDRFSAVREPDEAIHTTARLEVWRPLTRTRVGTTRSVGVGVSHDADDVLETNDGSDAVAIAYHWYAADGAVVIHDGVRTPLSARVPRGRVHRQLVDVVAPDRPGAYLLTVALVHEGVCWFAESAPIPVVVDDADNRLDVDVPGLGEVPVWTEHLATADGEPAVDM
jgi:hypothetical protein